MFQLSLVFKSDQRSYEHLFSYEMPDQDYYGDPVVFDKPAQVKTRFYKVQDKLFLDLKIEFSLEMKCARCLEPIRKEKTINKSFQLISNKLREEPSENDLEEDVLYYEKEQLDLDSIVHEQILLGIPIKMVCDEKCQGICSQCGKPLNNEGCFCEKATAEPETDPRLAKLKDWYQEE